MKAYPIKTYIENKPAIGRVQNNSSRSILLETLNITGNSQSKPCKNKMREREREFIFLS
jgi:hypothetical protein